MVVEYIAGTSTIRLLCKWFSVQLSPWLVPFILVVVAVFMRPVFVYFQNFPNFYVEIYGLGLGVRFRS